MGKIAPVNKVGRSIGVDAAPRLKWSLPVFSFAKRRASVITWHSLGSGPPPEGVKQLVLPTNINQPISPIYHSCLGKDLHCAPQTLAGVVVCRGLNASSPRASFLTVGVGQETVYTSTFLSFPIQIDAER